MIIKRAFDFMHEERMEKLAKAIMSIEAGSILDIGCRNKELKKLLEIKNYVGIDIKDADVNLDLNKIEKMPFESSSFDVVVLSHILEHLFHPEKILKEAVRISKKYIIIGLPNDFTYGLRLRYLFGKSYIDFRKYEHKGVMGINLMENFLHLKENNLKVKKMWYLFAYPRFGRFLLKPFAGFLSSVWPQLFANEVFFLCEK